jgi:multicomponent Na+:H+ antiporter subunit F
MIAAGAALLILLTMALVSVRLFAGPTIHDRLLGLHAFLLAAALLGAAYAAAVREPAWLDFSIVLVLLDLPFVIVSLKFLRYRTLHTPLAGARPDESEDSLFGRRV